MRRLGAHCARQRCISRDSAGFYVEKASDLAPAIEKAKAADGPAVVCVRRSRAANFALPPDALGRFVEVYQGPAQG